MAKYTKKRPTQATTPAEPRHFQVSVHTLMQAKDCPLRLVLKFLGYTNQDENMSLLAGTAAHTALAAWLRGEDWVEAISYYEAETARMCMVDDRRGYPNLLNVLAECIHRYTQNVLPFYVDDARSIECDFATPLGVVEVGGEKVAVDLIGQLDGYPIDRRTGLRWVLEHKTCGQLNAPYIEKFTWWDPQTTAYIWAAQQITGEPIQQCWVNAIELSQIPTSERKCSKHGVLYEECGPLHVKQVMIPVRRSPEQLATFATNALTLSKDIIKAAQFAERYGDKAALKAPCYGPLTGASEYCDCKKWCSLSGQRNPDMLNTLLRKVEPTTTRLMSGFVKEAQ